jgi:ribosomal protein S18 acetylase RimI-like enzyme
MEIRRAKIEDAAILSALSVDVQRLHAQALPRRFKQPQSDDYALQFMQEHLAEPFSYFFIARQDGLVAEDIGYIWARIVDRPENDFTFAWKFVYIDHISVKPAYQGKGYGKLLIDQVRALADQEGIDIIALDTWYFNEDAQAFFASQGFEPFKLQMWLKED